MIKFILLIGFLLNFAAYGNFYSTLIFLCLFYFSKLTKVFFFKNQKNDVQDIDLWLFSIFYFLSALSELSYIYFGSEAMPPDAIKFYDAASDPYWDFNNLSTEFIYGFETESFRGLKEDFIPILIWNKFYKFTNFLNIETGRYIGIAVNTLFLVWTSYIGLSIIRSTKDLNDKKTENFYKILFCANGIFWMYGSIHIRESLIIFFISILLKVWINWINKKSFFNLIILGIISIIYFLSAEYLRAGYSSLVFIFIFSFLLINIIENIYYKKFSLIHLFSYIFIAIFFVLGINSFEGIYSSALEYLRVYKQGSLIESSSGSLGTLVYNLPLPIRIFVSTIFLLITPIPIWGGQGEIFSLYAFCKSCFALFNYLTIPIFIILIKDSFVNDHKINKLKLFLIFIFFQCLIIIGLTTFEQRHVGNFSLIYILSLCYFNWDHKTKILEYKSILRYLFLGIYFLYFIYMILKFNSIYVWISMAILPSVFLNAFSKKKFNMK